MQLGHTGISAEGVPGATELIDTRICDCCQTSAAWTARGPVVVYRDRTRDEIRDISILRLVDGEWTAPAPVHADGWKIEGCPVNGPAVDARGDEVAVAWYTGANDVDRVNVAFSSDGGETFSDPVQVDDGDPIGRVDVVVGSGSGEAIVSWLERIAGEEAEVRLRVIGRNGTKSSTHAVARTSAARSSGFPRMAASGADLILAWTDASEPSRVRVARTSMP